MRESESNCTSLCKYSNRQSRRKERKVQGKDRKEAWKVGKRVITLNSL